MAVKPQPSPSDSKGPVRDNDPDDLSTSVAGEEDPGASLDLPVANAGRTVPPADASAQTPVGAQPPMAPGDQAPAGTPSTGEKPCPECGGTGRKGVALCPNCQGTGIVIVGIGGA
jgi:hypothetical protein